MISLKNYIRNYTSNSVRWVGDDLNRVVDLCESYFFDYESMIKDSPMLLSSLSMPFENLPLLINDEIEIDRVLAEWRLKIGK